MDSFDNAYTYEQLTETANFLKKKVCIEPKVAIICGSGLSPLADGLEGPTEVKYEEIPNFPKSTVQGHAGSLVFGKLCSVPVVVMKGRFHFYEGYPLWKVTMPCRVFFLLGCTHLIVTNAAGGINPKYKLGDVMLIKDHINFLGLGGNNPLRGPNDERFGERFIGINDAYDKELRDYAKKVSKDMGMDKITHSGVYASVGGPCYESVAELKMLQSCGADAVGMSTVPEVIIAKHSGLTVFAFSLITNEGILEFDSDKKPNHQEVLAAAKNMEGKLQEFVSKIVQFIGTPPCELGDIIECPTAIKYSEIPNFPEVTVEGHDPTLVFGKIAEVPVIMMKGRFHFFEGKPPWKCGMPSRVFKLLGCTHLIVTNNGGTINLTYKVGDIMMIKDIINFGGLCGVNPLRGPNDERFGDRFPSTNDTFDIDIRKFAKKIATTLGIERVHSGVYGYLSGPNYESAAEGRMLKFLGVDAVGMSTGPEVIMGKHAGLKVFGFSFISAEGIQDYEEHEELTHEQVLAAVGSMMGKMQSWLKEIVRFIGSHKPCRCKED